ncbi:MAG TPA: cell division protein FtsQ/DivIB, partial [Stellaceae bacterium]|nr:cell division protein FtsQ/DivIB [Stellaceae bacterium]
ALISAGIHAGLRLGRPHRSVARAEQTAAGTIGSSLENRLIALSARLGFAVTDIAVEGRRTTDPKTILEALGAGRGTPILAVDPRRAATRLAALPWVRSARIERLWPGTILVRLIERRPLALWQHGGRIELIDHDGAVIPVGDLGRFASLPLVVGADAASHAGALLQMLAKEPRLAAHVAAAVRVGGRRWNLRLDEGVEVLLPQDDPAAAWAELARLERKSAILQRDVRTIDMRLPDRLVLRVAAPPPQDDAKKKGRPTANPVTNPVTNLGAKNT